MKLLRRIRYWLRARQNQADLAEEMEFHRSMAGGSMGNITQSREDARAVWIWPWFESVTQDVRYALRSLRHQPGFATIAILALGCAIGLNTSFFTAFEAVALRPWPVKDARRIVRIFSFNTHHMDNPGFSVPEFRYLRDHATSFAGMLATQQMGVHFGFEPFGGVTHVNFVDADHFRVLGVNMALGRGFMPEEDRIVAPELVVVLSFAMWRDHFGSDREILGRIVHVDQIPFTVVGVAPEQFLGTSQGREDAWFPLAAFPQITTEKWAWNAVTSPKATSILLAGRLAPGITERQAQAELSTLSRQFHEQFNLNPVRIIFANTTMMAGNPGGSSSRPVFVLMFGGVTLIVLLACANVGNLLIARAAARRFEIEVRHALGAGRARIVRQLMTESLLLALGAVALGSALAYWLPNIVVSRFGEAPPVKLRPDLAVFGYAIALAIFCCVSFGLAPALHGTRVKEVRARLPLRSVLLAAQVAMSVVLLAGAALLLQGVRHSRTRDPGFSYRDVAVVSIELPAGSYDRTRIRDFSAHLSVALHGGAMTGKPVAVVSEEPWSNSIWSGEVRLPGQDRSADRSISELSVSPGYFELLRIPLAAGRSFTSADVANKTVLVNEAFARLYWSDANPVGKTILFQNNEAEVVGVVRDSYSFALDHVEPLIYHPFGGAPFVPKVLLRAENPGEAEAVKAIVRQLDPRARTLTTPLTESMERATAPARMGAQLAAVLGIFALALATIGMTGVFGYIVQQRTKEIGIRMALGARAPQVISLVLGGTARALFAGLAAGFVGAIAIARLLTNYLYGVSPFDPRAYAAVALVLAAAGLIAAFWPARRAAKIDPMTALRCE